MSTFGEFYAIIQEEDETKFIDKVEILLLDGWDLCGPVQVIRQGTDQEAYMVDLILRGKE